MTFIGAGMGLGQPSTGLRFATTRGRIQGSPMMGVNYPSPFFDIAHTYLPTTVKQLFRWCKYYFLVHPIINSVIVKLSEYPVTDVIIDHENTGTKKAWEEFIQDHLAYRQFQVEFGLDYFCYGSAFASISFPFVKYLTCRACNFTDQAKKIRDRWIFTNYQFRMTCPQCGMVGEAAVKDWYVKDPSGIRLVRWNPEDIEISYNDITGNYTYFYTIPGPLRSDIVVGKKDVVEQIPQIFIQALRQQKGVTFNKDQLFHMRRPTLANQDRGWGLPLILPVLKDCFYLQLMKKSQESILLEHISPLRVLFPQPGSGSSDPFTSINLDQWRDHVAQEIARWRYDCVTPETLVEERGGLLPASAIGEGMLLRNHVGTYSRVEKVWRRPLREGERAYKIVARGLSAVDSIFSEGHPIYAARKRNNGNGHKLGNPEFIRVKDLCVGDYVGYPVCRQIAAKKELDLADYVDRACTADWIYVDYVESEVPLAYEYLEQHGGSANRAELLAEKGWSVNQYKTAQIAYREGRTLRRLPRYLPIDEELAWAVGLYLAEGNVTPKQVLFAGHKDEVLTKERLERFFQHRFGASSFVSVKSENGIQLCFSSKIAAELLGNLCPGDSRTKRIPQVFLEAEDRIATSLLCGLFAGDGCLHEDGYSDKVGYTSASKQMAEDCRVLLLSLGVPATIAFKSPAAYDICGKKGMSAGCFLVYAHGDARQRLLQLFEGKESVTCLSSRAGVFRDGYFWHRIKRIEQVEATEVIGFQLERTEASCLLPDGEIHGTFTTWGMAGGNSNYIPILPLPIGQETIGGDGRALLLTQEMQLWSEQLINGMLCPKEFVIGGLSWAGSNVSMRMMENSFLGYILGHKRLLRFVIQNTAAFLNWPVVSGRFKPFKMADDMQRNMLLFQANQAQKVSDTTLLSQLDLSQEEENKIMIRETDTRLEATGKQQLAMAEIQGKAQMVMMKYQTKAQLTAQTAMQRPQAPGEPGGADALQGGTPGGQAVGGEAPPPDLNIADASPSVPPDARSPLSIDQRMDSPRIDAQSWAMAQAQMLKNLPASQQAMALQNLQLQSPELAELVRQLLSQIGASQPEAPSVDMTPLPEKLPPRRAAQIV